MPLVAGKGKEGVGQRSLSPTLSIEGNNDKKPGKITKSAKAVDQEAGIKQPITENN